MQVAAHVHAAADRVADDGQVVVKVAVALEPGGVREPVLGDPERHAPGRHLAQDSGKALGVLLPAEIGQAAAVHVAVVDLQAEPAQARADVDAAVVVDAQEVERALPAVDARAPVEQQRHPQDQLAGGERPRQGVVVELVGALGDGSVEGAPAASRRERHAVVGDADLRARRELLEHAAGSDVGAHQVLGGRREGLQVLEARRHLPVGEAAEQQDHRLVERHPEVDEPAQLLGDSAREALEGLDAARGGPGRLLVEPRRVREVMQRDHRADAERPEPLEHAAIGAQRLSVEPAALGLDAGPLDRHPVGLQAGLREQLEVPLEAVPVVYRAPAGRLGPARPLPGRPVVLDAAFDLVGGGRRAKGETLGKVARGHVGVSARALELGARKGVAMESGLPGS